MSLTYNNLESLTHRHIQPYIVDNVYTSQAFLFRLKNKGLAVRGGSSIQCPILYAADASATSYSGSDTWASPSVDVETFTNAKFDWKEYVVPFAVSDRLANIQNDGEEAAVDYLDSVTKRATLSLADILSVGLFGDGTGNSGKVITGLGALMSTSSTYGGIAVADAPTWVAKTITLTNPGELIVADMQRLWGRCTIGADQPTLLLARQSVFDKYSSLLEPQRRYVNTNEATAGFPTLEFMGRPFMVDNHAPGSDAGTADNALFMLNEKYLQLFVKKNREFMTVNVPPQITSANMYFRVHWAGNLACNDRRMQGFNLAIDPGVLSA